MCKELVYCDIEWNITNLEWKKFIIVGTKFENFGHSVGEEQTSRRMFLTFTALFPHRELILQPDLNSSRPVCVLPSLRSWNFSDGGFYSLISMRPIYYLDTWAIIWHGIACWFMVFPRFSQFLFVVIIKLFYENQNKNNLVIMLRKSWEILGNLQKSNSG